VWRKSTFPGRQCQIDNHLPGKLEEFDKILSHINSNASQAAQTYEGHKKVAPTKLKYFGLNTLAEQLTHKYAH